MRPCALAIVAIGSVPRGRPRARVVRGRIAGPLAEAAAGARQGGSALPASRGSGTRAAAGLDPAQRRRRQRRCKASTASKTPHAARAQAGAEAARSHTLLKSSPPR
jgi:hypothetical protein